MILELDPPRSAGPLRIGMPFSEAESVLKSIEGYVEPETLRRYGAGIGDYESGLAIHTGRSSSGVVDYIEIFRPWNNTVQVIYRDTSLFLEPADSIILKMSCSYKVEVLDGGLTLIVPELLLAFGRDVMPEFSGDDGTYFESVLVARPGYYDRDDSEHNYLPAIEENTAEPVSPDNDPQGLLW